MGKAILQQSLLLGFMFLLTVGSIKAEALNSYFEAEVGQLRSYCLLNISAELVAHPWMIQQCSGPDKSHCCEGINDIIQILLFSWMHTTRSFLLPTNRTAAICLNEFQRQLEAKAGIGTDIFNSCNVRSQNIVSNSETCLGIETLSSFESRVDSSGMKLNCNRSGDVLFQCNKCLRAMAMALRSLNKGSGGKSNCQLFVIIYVGGGINSYDGLGPDAAYCLLSVQNTTALSMKEGKRITKTYFFAAIPALVLLLVLWISFLYFKRRKSRLWKSKQMKLMQKYELLRSSTGLAFFSLSEIRDSTGNFAASNVTGEGGFSTVYKGTLPDGSRTAVKRLKNSTKIKHADFLHELRVISGIKHRNLLPLRGYCVEFDEEGQLSEQLLVSDFMENGSLADCLFNQNKSICLSWLERYKIGVGIARGISYLHEFAKPAIIHRDVKAANVLLDGHFNALVADFGLAKFKKEEEDENTHLSTAPVGTFGYVAPEYALYGHLSSKSDVFSFGIILLELITGRRALDSTSGVLKHILIPDWVVDMMQNNRAEEVIDMRTRDSGHRKTIDKVLSLALRCSHPKVVSRPSISEALLTLEGIEGPVSVIMKIESELEVPCNNRGGFSCFLSPGRLTDKEHFVGKTRALCWKNVITRISVLDFQRTLSKSRISVLDFQRTLSKSVQVKILSISVTRRKSQRLGNVYHVEFICEAKLLGR